MSQSDAIETLASVAAVESVAAAMGETCRNCGAGLGGTFCASCGQSVNDRSKSILKVVGDALQDFLHFDSRVLRTLASLLFQPGRMTRDYMLGRRTRYVPPLRLYLFSSLFFFITLSFANVALLVIELVRQGPEDQAAFSTAIEEATQAAVARGGDPEELKEIARRTEEYVRAQAPAEISLGDESFILPPGTTVRLRFFIDLDDWRPQVRASDLALAQLGVVPGVPAAPAAEAAPTAPPETAPEAPADMPNGFKGTIEFGEGESVLRNLIGDDWEKRFLRGIATSLDHPESLNKVLGDNIAKMMFVLMPLYAVLLSVLYWRRRLFFVDHLAFALHVHAFLFVVFTGIVLIREVGGLNVLETPDGTQWLAAIVAGYVWIALKTAYAQGAIRTTIKWLLLGWSYAFVLLIGMLGVLAVSLPEV